MMSNAPRSAKLNSASGRADAYARFGQLYEATRKSGLIVDAAC